MRIRRCGPNGLLYLVPSSHLDGHPTLLTPSHTPSHAILTRLLTPSHAFSHAFSCLLLTSTAIPLFSRLLTPSHAFSHAFSCLLLTSTAIPLFSCRRVPTSALDPSRSSAVSSSCRPSSSFIGSTGWCRGHVLCVMWCTSCYVLQGMPCAMGYVNLCHVPWVMLTYAGRAPRSNMGSAVVV